MLMAAKCSVVTRFRNTIGLPGGLSVRLQPNHPTDDARGIAASILDGLLLGSGDAVIGINPATDSPERTHALLSMLDEIRAKLDIPTQTCVLAHVTSTLELIGKGSPVDLVFQSIAGTQSANKSFGIDLALLREARDAALSLKRGTTRITASISRRWRRALTQSRARSSRCWSILWSVSSGRNICSTASRSPAPGWRIISAASCSACRWASTFATPTTPKPIRTMPTRCWRCWSRPASPS
jgi:hypothetical protein